MHIVPFIHQYGRGSLQQLPPHRNPGLEIVLVARGHLQWQAEGRTELVTPGSIFFTFPWEEHGSREEFEPGHAWHFVILAPDRPYPRRSANFALHPALGFPPREMRKIVHTLLAAPKRTWRATDTLAFALPALVRELENHGTFRETQVLSLAHLAIVELGRAVENGCEDRAAVDPRQRALARLIAKIMDDPATNWTLEGMAETCGLRRSQFGALFREATGDSPVTFVNRSRVARARQLLRETNHSITWIAHECGFSSSQYFARQFRAFVRSDAGSYRQAYLAKSAA